MAAIVPRATNALGFRERTEALAAVRDCLEQLDAIVSLVQSGGIGYGELRDIERLRARLGALAEGVQDDLARVYVEQHWGRRSLVYAKESA